MMKIPTSVYKYIVSGGIATCIDFVCYMLIMKVAWPSFAKTTSMIIANIWSYNVNKRWVFSSEKKNCTKTIGLYLAVQVINLITNVGINSLMLHLTGYVILSFVAATLCATIVNYTLQKVFVFR